MAPVRLRTHPAVRGFDRAAETYERGRPEYPTRAIAFVGRALGLGPGTTVVELGSGTGKLTRGLAALGAARVAIEPMAGMRAVFARTVPDVPVLRGTAEAIPLPGRFADAVMAGQAFHWFDARRALPEIARVLRPRGGLGLVWNYRDESVAWSKRLSEIVGEYRRRSYPRADAAPAPTTRDERWRQAIGRAGSPFGPVHHRAFRHVQRADRATFVDRALSVSVIAMLPAPERRRVADRVRAAIDDDPRTRGRTRLEMPYRTEVYWARKKGRSTARRRQV